MKKGKREIDGLLVILFRRATSQVRRLFTSRLFLFLSFSCLVVEFESKNLVVWYLLICMIVLERVQSPGIVGVVEDSEISNISIKGIMVLIALVVHI